MRILLIFAFGLLFQLTSFAQVDSKELQREIEKMQKEMQEHMRDFSLNFKDFRFKMDTLFFRNFKMPEDFDEDSFIMPDDIDMGEMMKMLERSFGQMDWSELEKMFEPFMQEGNPFMIPAPDDLKKEEKQPLKKKKKKTYSL